jgi:hypothetical protein
MESGGEKKLSIRLKLLISVQMNFAIKRSEKPYQDALSS